MLSHNALLGDPELTREARGPRHDVQRRAFKALAHYQPSQRYALVDVGDSRNKDLPQRNLVSALIALENSRSAADLKRAVDALVDWLREPEAQGLKRSFGEWIRQVLVPRRFGSTELPPMPRLEEVQTMLAERVKEWTEEWLQEGIERGLEKGRAEERALLCRMTARKFDAETAEALSGLLDGVTAPDRLNEVGDWLIECDTGTDLLERAGDVAKRP